MLDRDRLRMARLQGRLTQERLGKAIGQDQSYVSRLERGDFTEITVTTLERLANALHVSTDYLLGRQETSHLGQTDDHTPPRAPTPKRARPRKAAPVG
jgi:transcriptional regulator with XRE-family HTH domain